MGASPASSETSSTRSGRRDLALLPKAHLHLHLDGALRPSTLAELARRNGESAPLPSGFGSFADFSATIEAAARCMRTPDDVFRVVDEIAQDAASAGAVWVELTASAAPRELVDPELPRIDLWLLAQRSQ